MKKKNRKPLRLVAYHEAAHAVVNYRTAGFVGGNVSIVPRRKKETLGCADDGWTYSFNAKQMEAKILSCYAGGHAQRIIDPTTGTRGCDTDEEIADEALRWFGWEHREQELRERSLTLTRQHWAEVDAVADELLKYRVLDDAEVEMICDAMADDPDARADLELYRALKRASKTPSKRTKKA
jgi:ATP-dependent Zn protease